MAYPGCNLHPQGPQPTPAQGPLHGYLVALKASDSEALPALYGRLADSHLAWSWLTKVPLFVCVPPYFPAKPRPVPVDNWRTQPNPSLALARPAAPLLPGLGGRRVTAGPQHSLEPSSSWSMELHSFYGFLTPGGYSCSCSAIPSPLGSRAKESSGIGRGGKVS